MFRKIFGYPNGILLSAGVAAIVVIALMYSYYQPVVMETMTEDKIIALTVDDGPDPKFTPQIVNLLQINGARATFFVTGQQAEKYPEIVRMAINADCEIGNHTYSHPRLRTIERRAIAEEIRRTNGIIYKLTGKNVQWFRPPYGNYDFRVVEEAGKLGMQTILWSCVGETAHVKDPQTLARRVIRNASPGGIILIHDSRVDRTATVRALPVILFELQKQGYQFVTVSELLKRKGAKT